MKKQFILFATLLLFLLLSIAVIFFYKKDKYAFMRYVDRYSYLIFRWTPFGGKQFEKYSTNAYKEGIYIVQIFNGIPHKTDAVGVVARIDKNRITVKDGESIDAVELSDDATFVIRVPDPDIKDKQNVISAKYTDISIGDIVQLSDYDDKLGFERVVITKKYYDRSKL